MNILVSILLRTKQLAISRQIINLATRKTEYLLTLSMEEVHVQLSKETLVNLMKKLISDRLTRK